MILTTVQFTCVGTPYTEKKKTVVSSVTTYYMHTFARTHTCTRMHMHIHI